MSNQKSIHILYIEDDPIAARLCQKKLEQSGYSIDIARDGQEGLTLGETGRYDLLLIDQNMPVYDGLEVIHLLASQQRLPPTIMVTGTGDEQIAVQALKLGARDYVVKDIASGYLQLLPSVIEQVLNQQRLLEEKQQAEKRLRESEERYRLLAENSLDLIGLLDLQGNILYASPSHFQVLGYQPEEVFHQNISAVIYPDDLQQMLAAVNEVLTTGDSRKIEVRLQQKNNQFIWVEAILSIINSATDLKQLLLSARDITERKRVEAEREKLVAELQQALAEIKTLRGFIPICASCKKVRDDQGYWQQIEVYIRDRSEAQFSHGFCPDCVKKWYPDLDLS